MRSAAESITQEIRVEEKFAIATAKIRWQAVKGQTLPLLAGPAVLTKVNFPARALKLVEKAPARSARKGCSRRKAACSTWRCNMNCR